jgi:phospholipid/cholesterol/gamma-HCH transport system ATP-binding protein
MLYEGRIIAFGPPKEIRGSNNPILVQFLRGTSEGPIQVQ